MVQVDIDPPKKMYIVTNNTKDKDFHITMDIEFHETMDIESHKTMYIHSNIIRVKSPIKQWTESPTKLRT